ncbi:hypothetical protein CR513_28329, partial [Mucuna pruriens]
MCVSHCKKLNRIMLKLLELLVVNSIDSLMISTQTRDMTLTLCVIYLKITKYTNHLFSSIKHLHYDNSSPCNSLYNKIPWRVWLSKWPRDLQHIDWPIGYHYESTIIPSQNIIIPQVNVNVITLRSGKELP